MRQHQAKDDRRPSGSGHTPSPAGGDAKSSESMRQADKSDKHADTPSHARDDDARPTGLPNSDRHGMETAHYWEDEEPEAPKPEHEHEHRS
jgi:hypothetical protein